MSNDLRDIQPIEGALLGALSLAGGLISLFIALDWTSGLETLSEPVPGTGFPSSGG